MEHEPRPGEPAAKPRLDARMTSWLVAQRARMRELELAAARMQGELEASERIERAAQRYADRLEEKLEAGRKREASLARAVGYLEAQRDQLQARLGQGPASAALAAHELLAEPSLAASSARPTRPLRTGRAARRS